MVLLTAMSDVGFCINNYPVMVVHNMIFFCVLSLLCTVPESSTSTQRTYMW